ncbi:CMRF35-like molecule 8 [Astyanax mexicanus]|uniref:CMRF35-like molecule 8 n=1 Tax=Astyanax mexicanus TaxID=7994 RepID=UPI0020CB45D7|nr:CMRF35-like molecule 8 [Astyanax mexicanus]
MKILLVFTFYLISGPACCLNVIGYSGGSVIIYCNQKEYGKRDLYFCKNLQASDPQKKECVFLKGSSYVIRDRFTLIDSNRESFIVTFRELGLQDDGSYQCGANGEWIRDLNLKVNSDPCCLYPKSVIGYLGETVTISCSYPEKFQTSLKFIFKLSSESVVVVMSTTDAQKDRFSMFEDRSSGVVNVKIRDVREDDVGVYSCAVWIGVNDVSYYTLFQKVHLQVTGSADASKRSRTNAPADVDYENDPPGVQYKTRRTPDYQNMEPNTPEYLSLDPRT